LETNATGEPDSRPLRLQFDRSVKLAFHGSAISSDGGLLLHRELDDALGLTDMVTGLIADPRTGRNGRHRLIGFLRQSIFSRLAGYEDVNDADRLRLDPVIRQVVGGRAVKHGAASASAMGRFETEMLTRPENLEALADLPSRWIDAVHDRRPPKSITLDMDSSERPVHGDQEGAVWNGHFQSKCLHPLFVFNQYGDLERRSLRPGNVHSADGWEGVLKPVLARYSAEARPSITRRRFRADAAFAIPALFDLIEAEGWDYAIRVKGNPKLYDQIGWLMKRRPGRPPNHVVREYTSSITGRRVGRSRAGWWPRSSSIRASCSPASASSSPTAACRTSGCWPSTTAGAPPSSASRRGKHASKWTRLSCMRFAANAVRLQLHALAYNLANFLRTLATPEAVETWSLTSLLDRLIKTGARLVCHARYAIFQFAEAALPREIFADILARINRLRDTPAASVSA